MLLNTEKIRKYLKIIEYVAEKREVSMYSNVLLDTNTKELFFLNSGKVFGKLICPITGDPQGQLTIPVDLFLLIAKSHSTVEIKNNVFSADGTTYEFTSLKNKDQFQIPEIKEEPIDSIDLSEEMYNSFRSALSYMDEETYSPLCGVFIKNNFTMSSNRVKFYAKRLPSDHASIDIPSYIAKLIARINPEDGITLHKYEKTVSISVSNELFLWEANNIDLDIPDITDPEFAVNFDHPEFIKIHRESFLEEIKRLSPLTSKLPNSRVLLKPESEKVIKMIVNPPTDTITRFSMVEKLIPVEEYSSWNYFKDYEVMVSASELENALSDLTAEYILVKMDTDIKRKAINLYQSSDYYIIITKLKI